MPESIIASGIAAVVHPMEALRQAHESDVGGGITSLRGDDGAVVVSFTPLWLQG